MKATTLTAAQVVGTDLLFGLVVSAAGGALHFATGNFNPPLLIHLAAGGVPGSLAGAWLATRIPARPLRAALALLLVFLGGQLLWRGVGILLALG